MLDYTEETPPLVSIVVLNWNGAAALAECLPSVLSLAYDNYEVILVDNASEDESVELVRSMASEARVPVTTVQNESNLGNLRGRNSGAANARGEYFWFLDNDIKVEADCLSELIAFMQRAPKVGMAGPLLRDYFDPDKADGSAMYYVLGGFPVERRWRKGAQPGNAPMVAAALVSNSFLIRASVWQDVGGLEPSGGFCLDDNDLGPRVWQAGWAVAMVPTAVVYHFHVSRSSDKLFRERHKGFSVSMVRGMLRNYRTANLVWALPVLLALTFAKTLKHTVKRRDPLIPFGLIVSLWRALVGLPRWLRERKRVQARRRVTEDRFLNPDRYTNLISAGRSGAER